MKKQTKVLVAAAMLTLGASFSSMAALKNGTWVLNDEGWQYADREGEYVEGEWCMSNGKEFWINDDGVLGASEWVTEDQHTYYVLSDGSKLTNNWKLMYAEDDEDADEESWFWFDVKGRMAKGKKTIEGVTYYFDNEGRMLTGWVDTESLKSIDGEPADVADMVYCDENGALVKSAWIYQFPWDENSEDCYDGDEVYYYAQSNGKLYNNKLSSAINGLKYIFDEEGKMFTGWVGKDYDGKFIAINDDADDGADIKEISSEVFENVYYCSEDGHIKTNGWKELSDPIEDSTYWYHFDKLGRAFVATDANAIVNAYAGNFEDGEATTPVDFAETATKTNMKKVDGVKYYFNEEGELIDGLQNIDGLGFVYMVDGVMQTGKVTLTDDNENDYTFCFSDTNDTAEGYTKYVAVNGNMDGYCYKDGLLQTSEDKGEYEKVSVTIDGATVNFIVDYRGKIQHNDSKDYGLTGDEEGKKYTFNEDVDGSKEDSIK